MTQINNDNILSEIQELTGAQDIVPPAVTADQPVNNAEAASDFTSFNRPTFTTPVEEDTTHYELHHEIPTHASSEIPVDNFYAPMEDGTNEEAPAESDTTSEPTTEVDPSMKIDSLAELPSVETLEKSTFERVIEEQELNRTKLYNHIRGIMEASRKRITEKNADKEEKKNKVLNLLQHATFDPNTAVVDEYSKVNPMQSDAKLNYIKTLDTQPLYPVVLLKSGYRAWIAPLTNNEKIEIRNLGGTTQDTVNGLLKILHRKVVDTSIGKLKYQDFLTKTADEDLDTLLFGVFAATFPKPVEYEVTCPHCRERNLLKIGANDLIEVLDMESTGTYVTELLEGYEKGEDFTKGSLLNTPSYHTLPVSRIAIKLRTPSINHMLATSSITKQYGSLYQDDLITNLKFIECIYIPDIEAMSNGVNKYIEVRDRGQILKRLNEIPTEDLGSVRKTVIERATKYYVDYRIGKFNCTHCGEEVLSTPVQLMRLLFTASDEVTSGY